MHEGMPFNSHPGTIIFCDWTALELNIWIYMVEMGLIYDKLRNDYTNLWTFCIQLPACLLLFDADSPAIV